MILVLEALPRPVLCVPPKNANRMFHPKGYYTSVSKAKILASWDTLRILPKPERQDTGREKTCLSRFARCHLSPIQRSQKHTRQLCPCLRSNPRMMMQGRPEMGISESLSLPLPPGDLTDLPCPTFLRAATATSSSTCKCFENCKSLYIPSIKSSTNDQSQPDLCHTRAHAHAGHGVTAVSSLQGRLRLKTQVGRTDWQVQNHR